MAANTGVPGEIEPRPRVDGARSCAPKWISNPTPSVRSAAHPTAPPPTRSPARGLPPPTHPPAAPPLLPPHPPRGRPNRQTRLERSTDRRTVSIPPWQAMGRYAHESGPARINVAITTRRPSTRHPNSPPATRKHHRAPTPHITTIPPTHIIVANRGAAGRNKLATIRAAHLTVANYRALDAPTRHNPSQPHHRGELPGARRSNSPQSQPSARPWRITGLRTLRPPSLSGPTASSWRITGRQALQLATIRAVGGRGALIAPTCHKSGSALANLANHGPLAMSAAPKLAKIRAARVTVLSCRTLDGRRTLQIATYVRRLANGGMSGSRRCTLRRSRSPASPWRINGRWAPQLATAPATPHYRGESTDAGNPNSPQPGHRHHRGKSTDAGSPNSPQPRATRTTVANQRTPGAPTRHALERSRGALRRARGGARSRSGVDSERGGRPKPAAPFIPPGLVPRASVGPPDHQ